MFPGSGDSLPDLFPQGYALNEGAAAASPFVAENAAAAAQSLAVRTTGADIQRNFLDAFAELTPQDGGPS